MRNYIHLSHIVNNILLLRDEDDHGKYLNRNQLLTLGKEGIRMHISNDLEASFRSVLLDVNTNLNVVDQYNMPNDFIDWTKIGVLDKNCEVQVLSVNNKINFSGEYLLDDTGGKLLDHDGKELMSEKDCDREVKKDNYNNPYGLSGWFFHGYHYGRHNGRLFGRGGGNNARGYFRFNKMDNRIELDPNFDYSNGVVLEYVSDESMSSDPLVPTQAEEMLRNYIYWRSIQMKRNAPLGEKQIAKRNFILSKKQANFRLKMFTKQEAVQQINKNFQMAPKFVKQ